MRHDPFSHNYFQWEKISQKQLRDSPQVMRGNFFYIMYTP